MAFTVPEIIALVITGDATGAVRAFKQVEAGAVEAKGATEATLAGVGGSFTKLGAGALIAGTVMGVGLGVAAHAAQDLENAQLKAEAVFGKDSNVTAWAKNAADAIGLSKQAAFDAAGTFGNLGKAAGVEGKSLTDISVQLATRTADLAKQQGQSYQQVEQNIVAGLRGRGIALKNLGISVDQQTLKEVAYSNGLAVQGERLTNQQKFLAAYIEIMDRTSSAQGEFVKHGNDFDVTLKKLEANGKNLEADLGKPAADAFSHIVGGIDGLVRGFTSLDEHTGGLLGTAAVYTTFGLVAGGAFLLVAGQVLKLISTIGKLSEVGVVNTIKAGGIENAIGVQEAQKKATADLDAQKLADVEATNAQTAAETRLAEVRAAGSGTALAEGGTAAVITATTPLGGVAADASLIRANQAAEGLVATTKAAETATDELDASVARLVGGYQAAAGAASEFEAVANTGREAAIAPTVLPPATGTVAKTVATETEDAAVSGGLLATAFANVKGAAGGVLGALTSTAALMPTLIVGAIAWGVAISENQKQFDQNLKTLTESANKMQAALDPKAGPDKLIGSAAKTATALQSKNIGGLDAFEKIVNFADPFGNPYDGSKDVIKEQTDQFKQLIAVLGTGAGEKFLSAVKQNLVATGHSASETTAILKPLQSVLNDTEASDRAQKAFQGDATAIAKAGEAATGAVGGVDAFGFALEKAADGTQVDKFTQFADSVQKATDPFLAEMDAVIGLKQAKLSLQDTTRSLAEAEKEAANGTQSAIDTLTQARLELYKAENERPDFTNLNQGYDIIKAQTDVSKAQTGLQQSKDDASQKIPSLQLQQEQGQEGILKAGIADLEAQAKLAAAIQANPKILADSLKVVRGLLANGLITPAEAAQFEQFFIHAGADIDGLGAKIDAINNKTIAPKVDTSGLDALTAKINAAQAAADKLNSQGIGTVPQAFGTNSVQSGYGRSPYIPPSGSGVAGTPDSNSTTGYTTVRGSTSPGSVAGGIVGQTLTGGNAALTGGGYGNAPTLADFAAAFPKNPTYGQGAIVGGKHFGWDNTKWVQIPFPAPAFTVVPFGTGRLVAGNVDGSHQTWIGESGKHYSFADGGVTNNRDDHSVSTITAGPSFPTSPAVVPTAGAGITKVVTAFEAAAGPWEAYIPGDPSKRDRAISIWHQTGQLLGVNTKNVNASYAYGGVDEQHSSYAEGGVEHHTMFADGGVDNREWSSVAYANGTLNQRTSSAYAEGGVTNTSRSTVVSSFANGGIDNRRYSAASYADGGVTSRSIHTSYAQGGIDNRRWVEQSANQHGGDTSNDNRQTSQATSVNGGTDNRRWMSDAVSNHADSNTDNRRWSQASYADGGITDRSIHASYAQGGVDNRQWMTDAGSTSRTDATSNDNRHWSQASYATGGITDRSIHASYADGGVDNRQWMSSASYADGGVDNRSWSSDRLSSINQQTNVERQAEYGQLLDALKAAGVTYTQTNHISTTDPNAASRKVSRGTQRALDNHRRAAFAGR